MMLSHINTKEGLRNTFICLARRLKMPIEKIWVGLTNFKLHIPPYLEFVNCSNIWRHTVRNILEIKLPVFPACIASLQSFQPALPHSSAFLNLLSLAHINVLFYQHSPNSHIFMSMSLPFCLCKFLDLECPHLPATTKSHDEFSKDQP